MQIIADMHTHTCVTAHAFNTLFEMADAAREKGLLGIALTNHAPSMPDAPHEWHFESLGVIPRKLRGVFVLRGAEANIQPDGTLDLPDRVLEGLDYVIASFHEPVFPPARPDIITDALEQILRNPHVNTIGHAGNPHFAFDFERIISQCVKYGKMFEINASSLTVRPGSRENCLTVAKLCKKHGVPIVLSTDAHITFTLGDFTRAEELLREADFPEELVVNASLERLSAYFLERKGLDLVGVINGPDHII